MQLRNSWGAVLVFAIFGVVSVLGQDRVARYNLLVGNKGEAPCDLQEPLLRCPQDERPLAVISRDLTSRAPSSIANICTCNHVAFNIWSACRYYLGFTESPVYTDWLWTCANVNTTGGPVDVGKSLELAGRPGGLGIDVPRWAEVEVPGARTFDIQAAIVVSMKSNPKRFGWFYPHHWSAIQIVLPIVTAIVSALLVVLFVYLKEISRRKRDSLAISRARHGMTRLPSITSLNDVKRRDSDGV